MHRTQQLLSVSARLPSRCSERRLRPGIGLSGGRVQERQHVHAVREQLPHVHFWHRLHKLHWHLFPQLDRQLCHGWQLPDVKLCGCEHVILREHLPASAAPRQQRHDGLRVCLPVYRMDSPGRLHPLLHASTTELLGQPIHHRLRRHAHIEHCLLELRCQLRYLHRTAQHSVLNLQHGRWLLRFGADRLWHYVLAVPPRVRHLHWCFERAVHHNRNACLSRWLLRVCCNHVYGLPCGLQCMHRTQQLLSLSARLPS